MFEIIKLHDNYNDPTWSVIIGLIIFLTGVTYYIVYIMRMAFDELEDGRANQPKGRKPGPGDISLETQD